MDDGGLWISFAGGKPKTTVVSLVHDCALVCGRNLAESVTGLFDGRFARCE
jgi:hypothetical protein